jgi:transposase-like protein
MRRFADTPSCRYTGCFSKGVRLRIVRAVERGSSISAAARRVTVSPSAPIKLLQRAWRAKITEAERPAAGAAVARGRARTDIRSRLR